MIKTIFKKIIAVIILSPMILIMIPIGILVMFYHLAGIAIDWASQELLNKSK